MAPAGYRPQATNGNFVDKGGSQRRDGGSQRDLPLLDGPGLAQACHGHVRKRRPFALPHRPARAGQGLVRRCLAALAKRFDTAEVQVDKSVYNPARICRLYGTRARKGTATNDRPHRLSKILGNPQRVEIVPAATLESLAAEADADKVAEEHVRQPTSSCAV